MEKARRVDAAWRRVQTSRLTLLRSRKHFNPVGVREFYNVLNKINIPKDLVRNERRWGEAEKKNVNEKTKELTIPEWISF